MCEDTGGKVITTLAACQAATTKLGVSGVQPGSWGHVPPGCSMWGSYVH